MTEKRVHIAVNGIVQGVGFRPFIHKQITDHSLRGWVRNTSDGAELELEGTPDRIERFLAELRENPPRLALIESIRCEECGGLVPYPDFRIIESRKEDEPDTLVSPDVCVCEDCLREMRDPENRRYRYPFLNCTNCGPRFTIVRELPYDRKMTSMRVFPMCGPCREEYGTITDRRYHAEPTCCPDCGPKLLWYDAEGKLAEEGEDAIRCAIRTLKSGKIAAVKGLGGIHLACRIDADYPGTDRPAADMLRSRKERDRKAFALMVRDAETAKRYAFVSPEEERILTGHQRPIVLLRKRDRETLPAVSMNGFLGMMLPYTPLHYLLFEEFDALVMTSANRSELPMLKDNGAALESLRGIADGFLLNDRDIERRCDDSVAWVFEGHPYFARRSRGYVPYPMHFANPSDRRILACGAEQKASFCLTKRNHAFESQHIGDLKNAETLAFYEDQISHFEKLFGIEPAALACDLHPDYLSTGYAEERAKKDGIPLFRIQHHHAHMASCMEDNGLPEEPVIGIVWDGTGLGTDGTVWGSEFLIGNRKTFARYAHLPEMKLPGGDLAVREPWRIAVPMLREDHSPAEIAETLGVPEEDVRTVLRQLDADVNCPVSTGMGRLFDAESAILGICSHASYEGEGAVLLEAALPKRNGDGTLAAPANETERRALAFHDRLVAWAAETAEAIRKETGIGTVVLSGGTFQNQYLLGHTTEELRKRGFRVYTHNRVAPNDEGIAFGQAAIAREGGETYVPCSAFSARHD